MKTANTAISATYQLPAAYLPVHGIGYSTHDIVTEDVAFEPSRNGISYVDAECGRGKTYSTCQWIKQVAGMLNQMYIAPTTALLEQTAAQLEKLRLPYTIISHKNVTGSVRREVMDHLKNCKSSGNILLVTWSAYVNLPYFHRRENWAIYIDEIPQVDQFYSPLIPHNQHYLTDYLSLGEPVNETISRIDVKDAAGLKRHLERHASADDVYKQFHAILSDAVSDHVDLFVDTASWNRVFEDGNISNVRERNRVFFIAMLKPSLFYGATILGANTKKSMLYQWLTGYHGVRFHAHTAISSNLLPPMELKCRTRISYFSGHRWSKSRRDKVSKDSDSTIMSLMENQIIDLVGEREFLLVANNDYKGKLSKLPNAIRLPVVSKGMNEFTNHTMIVHLTALNRQPKHTKMLNQLGICSETIAQSTSYETLYQNVMRTNLRIPDSNEVVDIIVPSKSEADFLVSMFGSAEVRKIGDIEFKKFKPLTATEKNNRSKASEVTKRLTAVGENIQKSDYLLSYIININGNKKYELKKQGDGFYITMVSSYKKNNQDDYLLIYFPTIKDFVRDLKAWSKNIIEEKTESPLISNGIYEPTADGRWITKEGFITASMMVLDFDSGTVSPEIFEDIFWNHAPENGKRSFILANSFSRSPENPNRFRVFMPFTHPVKNLEEYAAIYDSIVNRLAEYGHPSDKIGASAKTKSGIDHTAKTGAQMFHAPCTNRRYPESRLFITKGCGKSEIGHYAINPDGYGRTALKPTSRIIAVPVDGYDELDEATRLAKIDQVKKTYLAIPKGQGLRNHGFYQAALDLAHLMTLPEVEAVLIELADGEKKMLDRIPDKIQTVKRKKYN